MFEVFYVNVATGWACAELDSDNNQVGEAAYSFHKADAIKAARASAGGCEPINVYGRDGSLQRTLNGATA